MSITTLEIRRSPLGSVMDLAGGLFLKVLRPVKRGDLIEFQGELGSVVSQGWFTTEVMSIEGNNLTMRNSLFFGGNLHNLTAKNIIRMDITLCICYSENMTKVKEAIFNCLKSKASVLDSPKPKISVAKLHQNHIELRVSSWCHLDNYMGLETELETVVKQLLTARGINVVDDEPFSELRGIA